MTATGAKSLNLSPKRHKEITAMYEEHKLWCQRTYNIIPSFNGFVIEMCKNGFHAWKASNIK